jgi:sec-independent protein translocase protein TatA
MFAFLNLGPFELVLIFLVILLLFGAKRLPELARGLGKSITEFKKASSTAEEEIRQAINTEAPPPAAKPTPVAVPQEAPKP